MKKENVMKNFFMRMNNARFNAWMKLAYPVVERELMKSKKSNEEVAKFEMAPTPANGVSSPAEENKELFNGTKYENAAEGERKVVTEVIDKPVPAAKSGWGNEIKIQKIYKSQRIVIGAVYVPYDPEDPSTVDSHGHACLREDIEKACYEFMRKMNIHNVDLQHNFVSGYGYVVECYLAKYGDPLFKEGTWVAGVKVTDDSVWAKVESGEITGFSLAGSAHLRKPEEVL